MTAMPRRRPLLGRATGALILALSRALAAPFLALLYLVRPRVPRRTIIELDLEEGVVETVPADPLAALRARKKTAMLDLLEALDRAARDRRVLALVARVGGGPLGLAHVEEIREAVKAFRAAGKPAVLFAETFGENGPGHAGYYLATAFDEIYLQPSGDVGLTGMLAEHPFLKRALDRLGVEPRLDHRHEYKNAKNLFTEERFTEAHREATQQLLESIFGNLVRGVSEGRSKSPEDVRALAARGPFYGQEALDAGLVDGLAYRDEVYARLLARFPRARMLYAPVYLRRAQWPHRTGPTVALIYGTGAVRRGESAYAPALRPFGGVTMGAKTVAAALRAAIDDARVRAIVFRIDSPGGSYVGSDTIWREVARAREAGKPLIVSMGNVAASGGYFVAAHAARILAQPSTVTGSIGVLAGKAVLRGLWEKLGVTWDEVEVGARGAMWSSVKDYSDEEWQRLQAALDRIYADFTGKVADGRGLARERVEEVARGRVWTGADAQRLGLVDELGGLMLALRRAREAIGLRPDAEIRLKLLPERKPLMQRLLRGRPRSSDAAAAAALGASLEQLEPLARLAYHAGLLGERGEMELPWW